MEEGKISHEEKLFKADFYRQLNGTAGSREMEVYVHLRVNPLESLALHEALNADISTKKKIFKWTLNLGRYKSN